MAVVDAAESELRKAQPERFAGASEETAQASARAEVWNRHSELADAYQSLPIEEAVKKADSNSGASGAAATRTAPVQQGTEVIAVLDEIGRKAYELVRSGQFSSLPLARAEVWKQNPDLAQRYARANATTTTANAS